MSGKITLQTRTKRCRTPSGNCETPLTKSLPFFKSRAGTLTHRVREGTIYWRNGEYSHTAVKYWCGGNGFADKGSRFLGFPLPVATQLCAVCEARQKQEEA